MITSVKPHFLYSIVTQKYFANGKNSETYFGATVVASSGECTINRRLIFTAETGVEVGTVDDESD